MTLGKIVASSVGGAAASFGSMLCCSGPVILAGLGMSGAGLSVLRPYRPIFLVITAVFLYLSFRMMDREEQRSCEPDQPCADPVARRRTRRVLWLMTALAVIFATSPRWVDLVF